ncbi:hypothetical protein SAMN04488128_106454 [Chitinophaga eiseniae]|uniref:Glycosyltransferase RgtA/B/C/D-like domain-containing protein n=1 Tax=Chitinophaga eiseniae TaxID=634771 RepID=A0A1T4TW30_9BACT|nr:hypothetical protein [Chitinophaga eiseniae]SKA44640.1 hypothetical protein SAMN04488128_106454 [Chitinophaga eiseniae]
MKKWQQYDYLICALVFVLISLVWSQSSNYTWDDDAISRFLNVQDARFHPKQFFSSWNRPLFVVLFYLPVQLFGRMGAVMTMVLLTAGSGILLYKALKHKGVPHAIVVMVFLLFQTFLFGISRDAMTEPLASFLICLGIYFFYRKQFGWFALVGGLLPLARPEGVLFLPFWLFPLVQQRMYRYIPLLGAGLAAWGLGLYVFTGQPLALVQEILASGGKKNRYDRVSLTHHIGKYVYVLGPVAFFFFVWGYLEHLKKMFADYFILLQFTVGFLIYVGFAVFMDLGQSGGALRNLITLAPFAAVICVYGFNYWWAMFDVPVAKGKKVVKPPDRRELWIYVVFMVLIGWLCFTNELHLRQTYNPDKKDYMIFNALLVCCLLAVLPVFAKKGRPPLVMALALLIWQVAFTLYYENPASHGNEERWGMNGMTAFLGEGPLRDHKVYCNHPWYFWASRRHPDDTTHTGEISARSKAVMQPGQLIVWESHYTGENYTNVPITHFLNDSTFSPVYVIQNPNKEALAVLFVKLWPQMADNDRFFQALVQVYPKNERLLYFKGVYERDRKKNLQQSVSDFTAAMALKPSEPDLYLGRGVSWLMMNDRAKACPDLQQAAILGAQQAGQLLKTYCK